METKGVISKIAGGKLRQFQYGMYTNLILSRNFNLVKVSENMTEFIVAIFWAGLLAGNRKTDNALPEGFEKKEKGLEIVADWLDEMSVEDCGELYQAAESALGFTWKILEQEQKNKSENQIIP